MWVEVLDGGSPPRPPRIQTDDATRHDWDVSMARCKSCGVPEEFVERFGETYCKARIPGAQSCT